MNWYQSLHSSEKIAISLIRGNHSLIRCLDEMKICDDLPDEQKLMNDLAWHRLIPAFYVSVIQNKLLEDYFSSEFLLELQTYHRRSVLQSLQLENIFTTFAPLLQNENIDFMLFKGITLAHQVYPTPPLRPILTIDILVDPSNVNKTNEILIWHGCIPNYNMEQQQLTNMKVQVSTLQYNDVSIEIHTDLFPDHEDELIPLTEIFSKAFTGNILGYTIHTLIPEHHLVYLIYRLHKHAHQDFVKMIWLLDLRLFLEKFQSSINLNEVELILQKSKNLLLSLAAIQEILKCDFIKAENPFSIKETNEAIRQFVSHPSYSDFMFTPFRRVKLIKKLHLLTQKMKLYMVHRK